jgi:hypothetical protein
MLFKTSRLQVMNFLLLLSEIRKKCIFLVWNFVMG